MPKLKKTNATIWVIFKHCEIVKKSRFGAKIQSSLRYCGSFFDGQKYDVWLPTSLLLIMGLGLFGIDAFLWCLSFDVRWPPTYQSHFSFFVGLQDPFSHQQQDLGIAKLIGLSSLHITHPDIPGILLDPNIILICPGFSILIYRRLPIELLKSTDWSKTRITRITKKRWLK